MLTAHLALTSNFTASDAGEIAGLVVLRIVVWIVALFVIAGIVALFKKAFGRDQNQGRTTDGQGRRHDSQGGS